MAGFTKEQRNDLLGQLIEEIQESSRNKRSAGSSLDHLYAHFFTKRGRLITDTIRVARAFAYLWDDVFLFEDFDLRDAAKVEVHSH